jgi:inosine/xanthosine triphosphatase
MRGAVRIAVASRNPVKVEALRAVAESLFGQGCLVEPRDPPAVRPPQPLTDEEAVAGARERALHVLPGADFGVGIEGGVMRVGTMLFGCNWAVVARDGGTAAASSARYALPAGMWDALAAGRELSDLVEPGVGAREGAVARVSGGVITRRHLVEEAVRLAFGQLLHPIGEAPSSP